MKSYYFLFLFFTLFIAKSQIQDLSNLVDGDYVGFNPLFKEENELYGYIAIFSKGKKDKDTKNFEYVILDKNLNKVANQDFVAEKNAASYYTIFNKKKELIMLPYPDYGNTSWKKFVYPEARKIDLESGKVDVYDYYCFEDDKFVKCPPNKANKEIYKEEKKELKEQGFIYESNVTLLEDGGFLVRDYRQHKKFRDGNRMMVFDENQNLLWKKELGIKNGDKKNSTQVGILNIGEKYIITQVFKFGKKGIEKEVIQCIDIITGEVLFAKEVTEVKYKYDKYSTVDKVQDFDNQIIVTGKKRDTDYSYLGYYRMTIDIDKKSIGFEKLDFLQLRPYLKKINKTGVVEKGYQLKPRAYFPFEDGSVAILTEKHKFGVYTGKAKTTDFVLIRTNENFDVKKVHVIKKDKTKWANTDYLFSQKLNDGKDIVFYYKDYRKDDDTKERNWVLGINTIIDGEFNNEELNISSEDNYISPYPAKEGYIMLREYNKKAKYNQIRLERLNF